MSEAKESGVPRGSAAASTAEGKDEAKWQDDGQEIVEPLKLDHLGPVILNADGTMARIANWQSMTAAEQESAKRLIGRRNDRRKQELLSGLEPPSGGGGGIIGGAQAQAQAQGRPQEQAPPEAPPPGADDSSATPCLLEDASAPQHK